MLDVAGAALRGELLSIGGNRLRHDKNFHSIGPWGTSSRARKS